MCQEKRKKKKKIRLTEGDVIPMISVGQHQRSRSRKKDEKLRILGGAWGPKKKKELWR